MRLVYPILLYLFTPLGLATDAPKIVHEAPVMPPGACQDQSGECRVRVQFVVLPSGATSEIKISGSSGYRVCDESAVKTISKRVYAPSRTQLSLKEFVVPYSCQAK